MLSTLEYRVKISMKTVGCCLMQGGGTYQQRKGIGRACDLYNCIAMRYGIWSVHHFDLARRFNTYRAHLVPEAFPRCEPDRWLALAFSVEVEMHHRSEWGGRRGSRNEIYQGGRRVQRHNPSLI